MKAVIFSLLLGLTAACGVRPAAPPAPEPGVVAPAEALADLRGTLRQLATRQHAHFETHGVYASDLRALPLEHGSPVTVVLEGHEHGWSAEATHPALPGRSCVYWYGRPGAVPPIRTRLEGRAGEAAPGTPVCDPAPAR